MNKGFGLLEIIITVFISTIFIFILVGLQRFVGESYNFSFTEVQSVEQARGGVDILIREIREAQNSESGSYTLERADDQEFIFYADVDNDEKRERVRYFLDGSDLIKGVIQPTSDIPPTYPAENETVKTISEYIRNGADPIFYYYNGDWPLVTEGNPLDTPARLVDTKYMRIFLRINVDPSKIPQEYELSSGVQLRNLKDNL
jgi:hypothetical protein